MPPKKEPYLEYFATECDEFHDMGAYEKSTDVNQIAAVYEKYRENPETAYLGCSMGIIYRDPEDSYYDEAEFAIVKGNTVFGNLMDDVRFYGELALVREGIEKIHEALPDYKYVGSVLDIAKVLTVTNEDVLPAYLQRVSDFEDCLLAICTKANQCDAIVTRNKKDFLSFWIIVNNR